MGSNKKRKRNKSQSIPSDPLLLARVNAVLESNLDGTPTSDVVVQSLLKRHKEYERRSLKQMLEAVSAILIAKRAGTNSDIPSSPEIEDQEDKANLLNAALYKRSKPEPPPTPSKQEPKKVSNQSNKDPLDIDIKTIDPSRPTMRFSDMGGIESCLQDIRELCEYPLIHPELYKHLGVEPPRGVLLHGPPGCGKTMLANAIAGELGVPFFGVAAPEIVSGMSGESEEKLRKLFDDAKKSAPSIIFIDEIDAITAKRDSTSRGMEKRIVAQLLTCMDSLKSQSNDETDSTVIVIGATNRPDSLDSALRRAGRFDREIALGIPDTEARAKILKCIVTPMRLSGEFDLHEIAHMTPGYVGADLEALAKEAAVIAVNRVFSEHQEYGMESRSAASDLLRSQETPFSEEQLDPVYINMSDFLLAVKKVQPSAKREGFATVPTVTWDDIGSLGDVRDELSMAITEPIRHPEKFQRMGLSVPSGVLLYGPPGCGKTMLAKAIANSSGTSFISVKGPELLNRFVGESERGVRQVFARARASAPCVIFFDELDSLCPRRGSDGGGAGVSERVVNQLLTEMDGLEERRNVFVVAATNRPDIIDPAMLRPGRLDKLLYVPLPNASDRVAILETCAKKTPLDDSVNLHEIATMTKLDGFTGADLASLIREAAVSAIRRGVSSVAKSDIDEALKKVSPSVSTKDQQLYRNMSGHLRRVRANIHEEKDDPPKAV